MIDVSDGDVTGRDFPRGKPHPMIFLTAAEELSLAPVTCFVVEDASSGVQAAKAGRMAALGVARLDDEALLTGRRGPSGDHATTSPSTPWARVAWSGAG